MAVLLALQAKEIHVAAGAPRASERLFASLYAANPTRRLARNEAEPRQIRPSQVPHFPFAFGEARLKSLSLKQALGVQQQGPRLGRKTDTIVRKPP